MNQYDWVNSSEEIHRIAALNIFAAYDYLSVAIIAIDDVDFADLCRIAKHTRSLFSGDSWLRNQVLEGTILKDLTNDTVLDVIQREQIIADLKTTFRRIVIAKLVALER